MPRPVRRCTGMHAKLVTARCSAVQCSAIVERFVARQQSTNGKRAIMKQRSRLVDVDVVICSTATSEKPGKRGTPLCADSRAYHLELGKSSRA